MDQFIFDSYQADLHHGLLEFSYILHKNGEELSFTERVKLPQRALVSYEESTLTAVLNALHIILGISYWKLLCPRELAIRSHELSEKQAEYWNTVYTKGLGEFFYQNSIDFRSLISFPHLRQEVETPASHKKYEKYLVGVGGGKDSAVAVELLRQKDVMIEGFVVETQRSYSVIDKIAVTAELPLLKIKRIVDPLLFSLQKRGDSYNGHIPISAIYSWFGILSSVLYGFDGLITSNERSANVGNVEYLGTHVNHQWSKSEEYETLTQEYLREYISPSISYASILRPYSEYSMVKMFASYPQYFNSFSSCNRNFSLRQDTETLWCGRCPKCAFVFALLGAHLPKDKVTGIFGQNLFDAPTLRTTYRELLGMEGFKPFECVGTPDEVSLAFFKMHEMGSYEESDTMKMFVSELLPTLDMKQIEADVTHIDKLI